MTLLPIEWIPRTMPRGEFWTLICLPSALVFEFPIKCCPIALLQGTYFITPPSPYPTGAVSNEAWGAAAPRAAAEVNEVMIDPEQALLGWTHYRHGGYNAICLLGHTDAIKVQRALLALMLSIWRDTGGPE